MHHAPSVQYPVGRSRFLTVAAVALWSLGLCGAAGQALALGAVAWPVGVTLVASLAAGAVVVWANRTEPTGTLYWDGDAWSWNGSALQAPEVSLDLQTVVLVRFVAEQGVHLGLWLERRQAPARWDDLRRALWAPRASDTPWANGVEPGVTGGAA